MDLTGIEAELCERAQGLLDEFGFDSLLIVVTGRSEGDSFRLEGSAGNMYAIAGSIEQTYMDWADRFDDSSGEEED